MPPAHSASDLPAPDSGGALSDAVKTLIRRLAEKSHPVEQIREAADALVQMQTHALSLRLSELMLRQDGEQLRLFGRLILASLAPASSEAARRLLSLGPLDAPSGPTAAPLRASAPSPAAMADLIRAWLREEGSKRPKSAQDWLPHSPPEPS